MSIFPVDAVDSKDPQEVKTYTMDWTLYLNSGATISTSAWTVTSGITKTSDGIVAGNVKTSILLSGGKIGRDYVCTNTVTTSDGETLESSGVVPVRRH
jgi:hypothetical protein